MKRAHLFQELGLVLVIVLLGTLLKIFGGTTSIPAPGGGHFEVNKFLRADNLIPVAKYASMIAIMAVGAVMVIISGGIDLSVGSIYALAAMCGAMALHHFGPLGSGA